MSQKTSLVFGCSSMDSKTLIPQLLQRGDKVITTYRRNTLNITEIHKLYDFNPNVKFEFCDIKDFSSVQNLFKSVKQLDEIYLLAAQSHVGFSFQSPEETILTNGMGVYNVLENAYKLFPQSKTYLALTSELFGGKDCPVKGYNEESLYDCRSPYSIGKELGSRLIKYYRQLGYFCCYGILFNHSGPYRSPLFFIRKVTNTAAKIALGKESSLELGNLNFWRDEHWSDFGTEMMIKMLNQEKPKDYVIANGVAHHGEEFLDLAFGYFNLNWKNFVKFDKSLLRQNEVTKLIGDSSLAQKELGWIPERISFKTHIDLMCCYDYNLELGYKTIIPNVFTLTKNNIHE